MRVLVLLRGAPGCGKSTFLRDQGLSQFSLCADDIRLQFQSPVMGLDGKFQISQKNDKFVWELLKDNLKSKMSRGELVVVDATHQQTKDMETYKGLCEEHGYVCYVVDFTKVPVATCKAQNRLRPEYKQVPEIVIDTAYVRFKANQVPTWITNVQPENLNQLLQVTPVDYSHWEKIHIIGDIQGCYTALQEYLGDGLNPKHLYILLGDLLDRGIENGQVLNWANQVFSLPNVIILEGNHEKHISDWAFDRQVVAGANDFRYNTQPQLEAANCSKTVTRDLVKSLKQLVYFTYGDKLVVCSHGGVSGIPTNFALVATQQLIKGVGRYEDNIDKIFTDKTPDNVYQCHGHRNQAGPGGSQLPIKASDRSYNLEGSVEFGGALRVVTLDRTNGFEFHETKNNVYKKKVNKKTYDPSKGPLLDQLRASKNVLEKTFGNISSFNFTRETMWEKAWTTETLQARGLFINVNNKLIVARSYNKFFNIGETADTQLWALEKTLSFPVHVYDKPNGFLGITGYDQETDKLIVASKSTLTGDYQACFDKLLIKELGNQLSDYKLLLKDHNVSGVFEVIDPVFDPHIVEYSTAHLVLLDLIHRTESYDKWDYHKVKGIAKSYGFKYKQEVIQLNTWAEFKDWYDSVAKDIALKQEGYVIEDSAGFMTKLKLPWYNFWKQMRSVADHHARHTSPVKPGLLVTQQAQDFYTWLKTLPKTQRDIISLRKEFEAR